MRGRADDCDDAGVNTSPFSGIDGKFVTSRGKSRNASTASCINGVARRVEATAAAEQFKVSGRGELRLAHPYRNDAPRGYELQVSRAEVIARTRKRAKRSNRPELVVIDVPEEFIGVVTKPWAGERGK